METGDLLIREAGDQRWVRGGEGVRGHNATGTTADGNEGDMANREQE